MAHSQLPVKNNVDLAPLNTLHIHAKARYFIEIKSKQDLKELLKDPRWDNIPIRIIGDGSNVLFAEDFDGLVVHIAITGKSVKNNKDYVLLTLGGGENWHKAVRYCVRNNWGGIENLSLIPGTAGAAPVQNIGAYGVELQDVFESLTAIEIRTGREQVFKKADCHFGYRDSIFKK